MGEPDPAHSEASETSLPERIGVYRIEGRLGSGGMGEVYLAHDDRLDRSVAIKRIRHDVEATSERRERLRREAQAVARLSHPSVVQIHDVVFDDDSDAIVMERVLGESLDRVMVRGGLDGSRALRLAQQVAEGLEAAHHQGLVHRDLKAENVMVTPEGKAKILDFGLVKEMRPAAGSDLTAEGVLVGTSRAMSPEQALGLPVDSRSDLFSFGVLCYELFTGHSPFRAEGFFETLNNVTRNQPPPPKALRPELPADLSALIEQLLEKEPDRRPARTGDVVSALRRLAEVGEVDKLASPGTADGRFAEPSPSGAPTGSWINSAQTTAGLAPAGPAAVDDPPRPASHWRWLVATVALLALAGAWIYRPAPRVHGISVLVPRAEVAGLSGEGTDGPLQLLAAGVRAASLGMLSSLDGITVVEPHRKSPLEDLAAARAEATDQILRTEIVGTGGLGRITLQRVDANSGQILATKDLEVSTLPQHSREVAALLQTRLQQLFGEYPPPAESHLLAVSDASYQTFLELRMRADRGERFTRPDLVRLEEALEESPQFLEGTLFAAYIANSLGETPKARALALAAAQLAPDDPRPLFRQLRIELRAGQIDRAEQAVEALERVAPGDVLTLIARAALLRHQGDISGARELQETVVQLRPSWQNLYELADIEYTLGAYDAARDRLDQLLSRSPGNSHGLELLARLELFFGDLERAEQIYLDLIAAAPESAGSHLVNLGLSRYLLGRFADAVQSYRQALELDSTDPSTRFVLQLNLANALDAAGDTDQASTWWRQLLDDLRSHNQDAEPGAYQRMMEAECLARLGSFREAVEITQGVLHKFSDSPLVSYQAALVYALTGDRTHSLLYCKDALQGGIRPRWFSIPAFAALRQEPELRSLLGEAPAPHGPPNQPSPSG